MIKKDETVELMSKINFKIQYEQSNMSNTDYVLLCAGKGKRDQSKIYIDKYSFSFIEGLIWDKYRQYGNSNKTKISSNEWIRITEGMSVAIEKLGTSKAEEIDSILKFNILSSTNSTTEIISDLENLQNLLSQLIEWVNEVITKEKYILIIKNDN